MDKPKTRRNHEIDFVKGVLVVGMVIYHSLDYFYATSGIIKYVRFISGAFILMSGFLISAIYIKKYSVQTSEISKRLYVRGFKLLILFILLNAVLYFIGWQSIRKKGIDIGSINDTLYIIFVSGTHKIVAFDILVPIAYTLNFVGLLIFLFKERVRLHVIFTGMALLYCSLMLYGNQEGYNLRYMVIGICGFALGFVDMKKLRDISRYSVWIFVLFLIYLIGLQKISLFYPQYVLITIFNLLVIFTAGTRLSPDNLIVRKIDLLGEYSLLSYLVQIAILQVLVRLFRLDSFNAFRVLIIVIITNALMMLCVEIVRRLRTGSKSIDRLYRIVFT
ncbi:MAG: hypothetical protein M0R70_01085 [Nitrospirae bacterium]|nr:hypothetical protein [Nitrospirota bacterium]